MLAPKLQGTEQWIADRLSFIPFVGGGLVTVPNYFIAGVVLAIMILPIVSAISRELMATVPADQKEAALGLGATRWEMIRIAVLPYCRSGDCDGFPTARTYAHVDVACIIAQAHPDSLLLT